MPFRRRRRRPPDRTRLKSVWRRALLSPSAQSHHPGVSGDRCAGWQLARVAERCLWPFQVPSSLPCCE
eukprot:scaffold11857_cov181-Isochrysis_galbana.AAC.1